MVPAIGAGLQRVLGGVPVHLVVDEEVDLAHVLGDLEARVRVDQEDFALDYADP